MQSSDSVQQTLPSVKEMVQNGYTTSHWLQYYKNVWTRQAIACAVDVQCDRKRKEEDPEMIVEDKGEYVPVKQRLENRKIKLQDALDIIAGVDALIAIDEKEFDEKVFSKKALEVDEDMLPKPEARYKALKDFTYQEHDFKKDVLVNFPIDEVKELVDNGSIVLFPEEAPKEKVEGAPQA